MRNIFKGILISIFLFSGALSAQTVKFGHIDFQQVLQAMPEKATADKELTTLGTELQGELTKIQKELSDKSKEYMAQQKTMTDAVRASKEDELNSLNQRVQNFPQQAQENLSKKENEKLQPIYDKLRKAINEVAKEQGLLYVFEVNGLLYHSEQSVDLVPLVKKKLALK